MKPALKKAQAVARVAPAPPADLLERYECGPVTFSGDPNASYDRHLVFDHVVRPGDATPRERFEALAWSLRDLLSQRWLRTGEVYDRENPKQVYYLSMEFLIGRSTSNNLINLLVEPFVREAARGVGLDLDRLGEEEPAYHLAKRIVHLVNNVAAVIDADPAARGRLKVLFLPEYNVTLAQRLIPAADLSEQISTAGYEASGTSNMKFMMNGALTVGTRDGATIEMAEAAGEENFFLFGLTAGQVADGRGWYSPYWHLEHEPETRRALDLIRSGAFDRGEPGVFAPVLDALLAHGDHYMHLADLSSYVKAQGQAGALYQQPDAWARKAVLNVGHSGQFSSDRTVAEYAADVWGAEPCLVD